MNKILNYLYSSIDPVEWTTSCVIMFSLWFTSFSFLMDVLAPHIVDMTFLLEECIPIVNVEETNVFLNTVLLFNTVDDHLHAGTNVDFLGTLEDNFNSVHLIIVHGSVIKLYLVTINTDLTLTILAQGLLDIHSIDFDKAFIDNQFQSALNSFINTNGDVNLKLTLIIGTMGDLLIHLTPFIPLQQFLHSVNWSFFACIYGNADDWFNLTNISSNLSKLLEFRSYLVNQSNDLFNMSLEIPSDDLAENGWYIIRSYNRMIRYVELIHSIYAPIDAIDNEVSQIMEEE